jgi:hypothetical protein
MTGTSSDAAFSDAYISGAITNITTALNIYKSNLANALRYSEASNMGRKLLNKSEFLGYMPFESSSGGNAREVTS